MSNIDNALDNDLKLYTTEENKEKITSRLCDLASVLDPTIADCSIRNQNQPAYIIPDLPKRQTQTERQKIEQRLNGFDGKNSDAWSEICDAFGPNLSQNELLSIAQVTSFHTKLHLGREAKRRKEVLIKWFQENLVTIRPFLNRLILEDYDGNRLGPSVN